MVKQQWYLVAKISAVYIPILVIIVFSLFCSKRRITEFSKHFSFLIKNILTKGSLSGTNPKTADTSNSRGEGTEQAEAIDAKEEEMGVWERIRVFCDRGPGPFVTRSSPRTRRGARDKPKKVCVGGYGPGTVMITWGWFRRRGGTEDSWNSRLCSSAPDELLSKSYRSHQNYSPEVASRVYWSQVDGCRCSGRGQGLSTG